jgi:hypothetical protein
MRFIGQTEHGIYVDDCAGVHPDVINQYYGVHRRRSRGNAGGSQTPEGYEDVSADQDAMDEGDWLDLEDRVAADQESNFHHEAVEAPKHANPFPNELYQETFEEALTLILDQGEESEIPSGYGLLPEEWEDEEYPSVEIIKTGRRGGKELRIALPDFQWRPRAVLWGQTLDIMNRLTYMYENEVEQ